MSKKIAVRNEIVIKAPRKSYNEMLDEMAEIIKKHKLSFRELKPLFEVSHPDYYELRTLLCYNIKHRYVTVGYINRCDHVGSTNYVYNFHVNIKLPDGLYEPIIIQGERHEHFWTGNFECVVGSLAGTMLDVLKNYVKQNRRSLTKRDKRAPITVREWEETLERISQLEDIVNKLADNL